MRGDRGTEQDRSDLRTSWGYRDELPPTAAQHLKFTPARDLL